MKTFLPQNKFMNSASDVPSAADEAGASPLAPTPEDVPADISVSVKASGRSLVTEKAAIDSCQEPVAADFENDLDRLLGVKPKPARRRLKLPRFAPDYEAIEAAMHDSNAPRALETDPVWADAAPLFLKET